MSELPETQYARTASGAHLAYQVFGEGPVDLLFEGVGGGSHVDMAWEVANQAHFFRRLASFSRLIRLDHRGSGLSDPLGVTEQLSLEEQAEETLVVLDAVGSERAAIVANGSGGLLAIYFAATYPQRTSSLVLDGCYARLERADDYSWGVPKEVLDKAVARAQGGAGSVEHAGLMYLAPKTMKDSEFARQWRRWNSSLGGPAVVTRLAEMAVFSDLRPVLPAIQVPTLVLYRKDDPWVRKPHAEYLAEHIAGAKLVELPGDENLIYVGDTDAVVAEIEEFLTGARHHPDSGRVLATVLFTDIVRSTERAAGLGDRGWRELLDAHDALVRRQLERFRGKEVHTVGDGFLATFDGPGRGIECACAIRDAVQSLAIEVRAGLHTGEIELRGDDVAGMAVHIGARVAALAGPGEVLVSGAIPPLVAGSSLEFDYRGEHELKGVPGFWKVFAVRG